MANPTRIPPGSKILIIASQVTFEEILSHTFVVLLETEDGWILTTTKV